MSIDALFIDRVVNMIDEGLDVAVRIGSLPDSGFTAVRIGQVRRTICASPSNLDQRGCPASPAELASHQIVSMSGATMGELW